MRQSSQFFCVQQELKSQMFEFNEQTTVPVLMYFQCLDKKIVEKQKVKKDKANNYPAVSLHEMTPGRI